MSDETNARISGDAALQVQINTNTNNLANVANDLAQETLDRIAGDDNLQNQIQDTNANLSTIDNRVDQEILDRVAGDQQNQANLESAVNLINADIDLLGNAIQTEANVRANADQALSDRIDIEDGRNDVQDGEIDGLDARVAELENRVEFAIDYEANLTDLGNVNTQVPQAGEFIPMESQLPGGVQNFILPNELGQYTGGEQCNGFGYRLEPLIGNNGQGFEVDVTTLPNYAGIDTITVTNPGYGYEVGDRFEIRPNGVCFGPSSWAIIEVTSITPNTNDPGKVLAVTLDERGSIPLDCASDTRDFYVSGGSGSGIQLSFDIFENNNSWEVYTVSIIDGGEGYVAGDILTIRPTAQCFGPTVFATVTIDAVQQTTWPTAPNEVTDKWKDVRTLYMNAVDDEGTFHFLDGIKKGDDLVFQHRTQPSFCRMEVTANVSLTTQTALTGTANVQVVPVAFNGNILPGNGTIESDYTVQFFPSVAGDVPTYDYVDTQDNRRVLKTGDTMTGALHMRGGDVIAYGNTGSKLKAVQGADVDIADDGSLVISGTGKVSTNRISNVGGSSINFEFGGSNRFQIASTGSYFLNTPAKYTSQSAAGVGNDTLDLIHKGYLDTRINNLDLANTYVAKAGDTMFGELAWDDNIVNTIKIAPLEGSPAFINYFEGATSQTTLIDVKLRGDSDSNRYRILGGDSAANTMVTYTSSGDIIYSTDVSMNANKITDLGNPDVATDAANKGYVDGAITQSQADLADVYVAVAGDTMTGELTITGGGLRIANSQNIIVEGGDVRVINNGSVVTNTLNSQGNSNMTLRLNSDTKLLLGTSNSISFQPIRYNNQYTLTDDLDLINKGYVDGNFIKNGDTTTIKSGTELDVTDNILSIKGPDTGIGFQITKETGGVMFYQEGNDIRVGNHDFNNDHSVVNRSQGDNRYGLKGDFLEKSGGTMTGKLTTEELEVTDEFTINNPDRSIHFRTSGYGHLKVMGRDRVKLGINDTVIKGILKIEDGLTSDTGLPVDGKIDMNNRKIVNLLNPEGPQDAATKYYVDERVAQGGGNAEGAVLLTGDNLTETEWRIKNAAGSKTFLSNTGNEIGIYNVKEPTADHHAMPRSYADSRYLRNGATQTLSNTTTIKPNSNAKFQIQNYVNNSNNFFKVLSYSGSELFGVDGDGMVRVPRTPSAENHVANKKYVDDKVANASGGGVELYGNSSPPSTKDRGTLLMTSTNNFYIYV